MSSVNKAILVGRLGKDPELRYTTGGTPVARFSLATSETWTDKNGERQERTQWHNIVAWNKLADICNQYLVKGKQVFIEGRIETREYDDRDGNKRRITEIRARDMVMLDSRGSESRESQDGPREPTSSESPSPDSTNPMGNDEIPF